MDIEPDLWNHQNYAVPPENLGLVEACFSELFPWEHWVSREDMVGYRFQQASEKGMAFFRPAKAAGDLAKMIDRLRKTSPELDRALVGMDQLPADHADHSGFMVHSVDEWERRVAAFERAVDEHPEWQLRMVDVHRPGDPDALTDRLYQAFLRIGLLGPIRNTFEMQCLNPDAAEA